VDAFRKRVQKAYLESDLSKSWPKGLIEKINAL
jgi:TRAP-type transport system periplasmic protein